jgi:hypothetical protein
MQLYLTCQVEEGRAVLKRCDGKAQVCLGSIGILECVPKRVPVSEKTAANLLPVALRVIKVCNRIPRVRSDSGPASLSNPNLFATSHTLCLGKSCAEVLGSQVNGVGLGRLEVRKGVVAKPVDRVGDSPVLG